MNFYEHIDIYCERLDSSFWAEPVNTLTTFAFIFVSLHAYYKYKKTNIKSFPFEFLLCLVLLLGIGSFLFHTFSNKWSYLTHIIFIWAFVLFYIIYSIRFVFNISWFKTIRIMLITLVLFYITLSSSQFEGNEKILLSESIQYAPVLFLMIIFAVALYLKRINLCKYAFYAVGIFIISLLFRSVDMDICRSFSMGSHFIWHILNALVLYFLLYIILQALIENKKLNI